MTYPIIGHLLYGTKDLKERAQEIPSLEEFTKYNEDLWLKLLDKYMIGPDSRHVCIVGEPSPSMMQILTEKERVKKQKENLKDELPQIDEQL